MWASTCQEIHSDWWSGASPSLQRLTLYPQQSLMIVVPGRIHALMMGSNVWVDRSATGVPNSRLTPTKTHTVTHNWPQLHFCLLRHLSYISITMQPQPPLKNRKEQNKMKFDIALQQNCDQSAIVWWSKCRSARNWRVREWCLTWNESANNNREPI